MCGIAGSLSLGPEGESTLRAMIARIRHRGPDDFGIWHDAGSGVGLAHARLSILDLSPAGHQPMTSAQGRFVVVFNGEIYNHLDLRRDLAAAGAAPPWRGHADTETLLAGFEAWGIEATLRRAVGMFGLAVWDKAERVLSLARDRTGEKPLYYGWAGKSFVFASDLAAIRAHPSFQAEIDRDAVALLLRQNYIASPWTIYKQCRKLSPGALLSFRVDQGVFEDRRFWDARGCFAAAETSPFRGSPEEAIDRLDALLSQAVESQMLADVPIGAFLSGGVDSSTIVALMQKASSRPVRTFTIGFDEPSYNEAIHARAVAAHLGTEHTELYITSREALEVIPRLPSMYSEPFADSSQIPTYLVSALTRQSVTVALSGDAGDELFGGYNRYLLVSKWWSALSLIPRPVRGALSSAVRRVPASRWSVLARPLQRFSPSLSSQANIGDKLMKAATVLGSVDIVDLYQQLVTHWDDAESVVLGARQVEPIIQDRSAHPRTTDAISDMMALDLLTYLPDDILVKVDRAAMSVGLETRVPMLDHRVIEFAWRLPLSLKIRHGLGKWALRQVLYRYVPRELIERPKLGFAMPISAWLRGPLRDWAEAQLSPERLRREGIFDVAAVRQKWDEHLRGDRDWQYRLWCVLMFQGWYEAQ
jgi:asparagine synthase (glutamine-hydrolysing)